MKEIIEIGDAVAESPVGEGVITGFTERGYPQVNHVAVGSLRMADGGVFDPHGHYDRKVIAKEQA